jgi:transposase InsO family protein
VYVIKCAAGELGAGRGSQAVSQRPTQLVGPLIRRAAWADCLVPAPIGRGRHDRALRPVETRQFRSNAFVTTLMNNGLIGSMGRVGACGDDAAMESFFALLQRNVLGRQRWSTREDLRLAIITEIEKTYHRRRRQCRLVDSRPSNPRH